MKRINNNRGFALVETLVVATFVLTIFVILIANYYPLFGKLDRYSNYDETENIYIAYHLVSIIKQNSTIFNSSPVNNTNPLVIYEGNEFDAENNENSNYLCNYFETNKELCESFLNFSKINKIYITNYSSKPLKDKITTISNISRAFELYVKYMPSHDNTKNKIDEGKTESRETRLDRIIIERKLDDGVTGKKIYKYANYEVEIGA